MHQTDPSNYENQLSEKVDRIQQMFQRFSAPTLEVFSSPTSHYRMRAEFKVWHKEDGQCCYAMYQTGEYKKPYPIDDFDVGSKLINQLMPKVLKIINANSVLQRKLFQAEFLTTLNGEALLSLIYHKPLNEEWTAAATELKNSLNIDVIGRSRKQKVVLGREFVIEKLSVNSQEYIYQQVESSFTQPNAKVCEQMLTWAVDNAKPLTEDLLELYCGNGNFTIPLSTEFNKVLATEISKVSVNSALYNLEQNNINNVSIVRMSSEEFTQALQKERPFRRLKDIDLDHYQFSTVLVDPPRAGLDDATCELISRFDNIIYISCNPETLEKNLDVLSQSHKIEKFALFDQFPYTHHIECGVILKRK